MCAIVPENCEKMVKRDTSISVVWIGALWLLVLVGPLRPEEVAVWESVTTMQATTTELSWNFGIPLAAAKRRKGPNRKQIVSFIQFLESLTALSIILSYGVGVCVL